MILATLMVEYAHTQGLGKSIGTQMNFGECILGQTLPFRGSYIIPSGHPVHRKTAVTIAILGSPNFCPGIIYRFRATDTYGALTNVA